jgi:hypothetical protein
MDKKKKAPIEDEFVEEDDDDYNEIINLKPFTEDREAVKYPG